MTDDKLREDMLTLCWAARHKLMPRIAEKLEERLFAVIAELAETKARLASISKLPNKWRDDAKRTATPDRVPQLEFCATELDIYLDPITETEDGQ